ncbi:MAG: FkbM family methyltransferase [Alphaproteobacteria bacterium]|nr:FkbM family methyltransferase [Alphaproteobacteria bacterium]
MILHKIAKRIEKKFAHLQGKGFLDLNSEIKNAAHCLNRQAKQGGLIIFDCGANKGDWSLGLKNELEKKLGASGLKARFYMFEPSALNIQIISDKIKGDTRFEIVPHGVSNEAGETVLYNVENGAGLGSIYKRNLTDYDMSMDFKEEISLITLDHFIEQNHIEKIDYLKLDIEGHELCALEGAQKALTDKKIQHIQFEFGGCNIDSRTYFHDFYTHLREYGYLIYRITPLGLLEIKRYHEIEESFLPTNYIASLSAL